MEQVSPVKPDACSDVRDERRPSAPVLKKESPEEEKVFSSVPPHVSTPQATGAASSTQTSARATPSSSTSSKPYSPPPAQPPTQPPAGPRYSTAPVYANPNPPTGPRAGPPPAAPRAQLDRERERRTRERGGSTESTWSTGAPVVHSNISPPIASPHKPPPVIPVREPPKPDLGAVGNVHPDRLREIETLAKGNDDPTLVDTNDSVQAHPTLPQRGSSVTLGSRPGSASSNTGLRSILNPAAISAPPTPTTAVPMLSPTPGKMPPTGPRALNAHTHPRGVIFNHRGWVPRGGGFRGGFNNPLVKREPGDEETGPSQFRGGRGFSRGMGRRRSRTGMDNDGSRAAFRESSKIMGDVEMVDVRTKEKDIAPPKEDVEMVDAPPPSEVQLAPPPRPASVLKSEDDEEEDVSLTQADVISKISDIDKELEEMERKLVELGKQKQMRRVEIKEIDRRLREWEKQEVQRMKETKEETQRQAKMQGEGRERRLSTTEETEVTKKVKLEEDLPVATPSLTPTPSPSASDTPTSSSDAASVITESDESMGGINTSSHALPGLPFFRPGPPMQPSDYGFFQDSIEQHEAIKDLLLAELQSQKKEVIKNQNQLKRKYNEYFTEWHQQCQELDKEPLPNKKGSSETVEARVSPTPPTAVAPETYSRRAGRSAAFGGDVVRSEAEMEQVMRELQEQDMQTAAEAKNKIDGSREAIVPDMVLNQNDVLIFRDDNGLLQTDEDIRTAYEHDKPPDNWTDEESNKFCDLYAQFPKQWGKIAAGIEGRDFHACIQHYYMTKKAMNYKDLLNKGRRRRKGRKPAAPAKTRQSALLADLGKSGKKGGDEEEQDSEDVVPAMTESGRPKRAAAPVFGDANRDRDRDKSNGKEEPEGQTNGKKGNGDAKADEEGAEKERGTKRNRSGNNGRERGQSKRVKPATPAPSMPPTPLAMPPLVPLTEKADKKIDKKKEDLKERESDAISALTGLSGTREEPAKAPMIFPMMPVEHQPTPPPQPPSVTSTPKKERGDKGEKGEKDKTTNTSSYWSVPEVNDFPHLLAAHGTNWALISQNLASKTTVMVSSVLDNCTSSPY